MDHVDIPAEQVIPMDAIAEDVQALRITFVNVFAIGSPSGPWTLVDAGIPFSETIIRKWAEKHFSIPPTAIMLTHGHFDHVSAAQGLAEHWNVPIFAHPLEFPYLNGQQEYPAPNPGAGGGLMSLLSPIYPRGPINVGSRLRSFSMDESSSSSELPEWQILHTPGHTPGHVSLFRSRDRVLLPGDAFCTTKPESFFEAALAQEVELHGPPAYFTSDWNAARKSVQRLAQLQPTTLAPGHGKPLTGPIVAEALQKLAANFDAIAVPKNRKYQTS